MNTHTKLLVTVGTSLVLGVVLGWGVRGWFNPAALPPSPVPYAIGQTVRTITKLVPGKPGECPSVEVTSSSNYVPTTGTSVPKVGTHDKYSLGLHAVPRAGVPTEWRGSFGMRLLDTPLVGEVGVSYRESHVIPDLGVRVTF